VAGVEKLFEPGQQGLTVTRDGRVGEFAEVFDFADQVSQAELDPHATLAGVFAIGPQKSAPRLPWKFWPKMSNNTSEPREA